MGLMGWNIYRHEPSITGRSASVTAYPPISRERPRLTGRDFLADVSDCSSIRKISSHVAGGGTTETRATQISLDSVMKFEPT